MRLKLLMSLSILLLVPSNLEASNVWNQKSNVPAIGRHRGTGIAIGDKGYIGLGHMNGTGVNILYDDWWEFDPATNSWTQKADFPQANYGALAFSANQKGYVGGGVFLDEEFFEFDPILNTWIAIPDAPFTPSDRTAFSIDNKGYVTDGQILVEYDPITTIWTQKQSPPQSLNSWCTSFVVQNSGFVKSGFNLFEYKPSADIWLIKNSYPGLVSNGAASFSINNKGYFLTGYMGSLGLVSKAVWEYDPASDTWLQQPDFYGTSRRFSVAFSINNKGYIGTGTNGTNFNDFWEYNRVLSIDGIKENISLSVYPNPATHYIKFDISSNTSEKNYTISILTINGKELLNDEIIGNQMVFQKGNLPDGIYIYTIKSNGKILKNGQFIFN